METNLEESIKSMCDSIIKDSKAMNLRAKMGLSQLELLINDNFENNNLELVKEIDKLISSIIMYEWVTQKKIETLENLKKSL